MDGTGTGKKWLSIITASIASFFLYQTVLFSLFFLVPLQIIHERRGFGAFSAASATVMGGAALFHLIPPLFAKTTVPFTSVLDIAVMAILVAGVFFINVPMPVRLGKISRMIAYTALFGIVSSVVFIRLDADGALRSAVRSQVSTVWELLTGSVNTSPSLRQLTPENLDRILSMVMDILFNTYLFSFFLMLALNWRLGATFAALFPPVTRRPAPLLSFYLEERVVWALLIPWTVNLISLMIDIGPAAYPFWNIGLIVLFLYGLQGMGILNFLILKYVVGRVPRTLILAVVITIIIVPGANLILLIGLPLLGVSEVWIKFRKS